MDIDVPIREVGSVAIRDLRDAVLALPAKAWLENQQRQQDYDVHKCTESIVLIFTDGEGWPDITLTRESGWELLADVAVPLMESIILRRYTLGGTIIRAMLAKLPPGEIIKPHRDQHPSFHHSHRIHVPIKTNPRVRFMIDGRPYGMEVGEAYEINNQKLHSVMNKGEEERINFIFDYVPANLIDNPSGPA